MAEGRVTQAVALAGRDDTVARTRQSEHLASQSVNLVATQAKYAVVGVDQNDREGVALPVGNAGPDNGRNLLAVEDAGLANGKHDSFFLW